MWGLIWKLTVCHQILACLRPPFNHSTIIITMSFDFSKHLTLWRPFMPVWLSFEFTAGFQRRKWALRPFDSHLPAIVHWHLLFNGEPLACNHFVQNSFPAALDLAKSWLENCTCTKQSVGEEISACLGLQQICGHVIALQTTPIDVPSRCESWHGTTAHVPKCLSTCSLTASQVFTWPARGGIAGVGQNPDSFGREGCICLCTAPHMLHHLSTIWSEPFHQDFICKELD